MTVIVNMHEAKSQLSKLVARACRGEDVLIARNGTPVARISAVAVDKPKRVFGAMRGTIWMSPDFNDPDPEIEKLFYEGEIFPSQ
ncbi:MAG: type II toxin-antitoxin system prevent-host-death family antitoxin [Rhodospirillaceae bacterium]|nr:type II toxin-antitoxin system prevent-host-death family antitoxin [Rhodospirillaceae bacterium]